MAIPPDASGHPSPGRTAARLLAEWAGFAVLLFLTRLVARAHLLPQVDEECHIGAIAVDLLAHGIRFPLLVYAPTEYNNGSFYSGLLTAGSFALLGRNVIALKLGTQLFVAAGAVATLGLLRGCLDELGVTRRPVRWAATLTLVIAVALAPLVVTTVSLGSVGLGSPPEGAAMIAIALAVFARRRHARSPRRTAAFWALLGVAVYLNRATALVLPVLGVAELALDRSPLRLAAAAAGFLAGVAPGLIASAQRGGADWSSVALIASLNSRAFPHALFGSIATLAEQRPDRVALWALALAGGTALLATALWRAARRRPGTAPCSVPLALGVVVGLAWTHLAALSVLAQGGLDHYTVFGYPTLAVLVAVLVAVGCDGAARRAGHRAAGWIGAAAVALMLIVHWPAILEWNGGTAAALWRDRAGAACSWHLAAGFEREHRYGLAPPRRTLDEHVLERCRSLADQDQILDCIGGIARERQFGPDSRPTAAPPGLGAAEQRAYAFYHGIRRGGDAAACDELAEPKLVADCTTAVLLECLVFADINTRLLVGRGLGRPRCPIPAPPMDTYWAAMRAQLLARPEGEGPYLERWLGEGELAFCQPRYEACY